MVLIVYSIYMVVFRHSKSGINSGIYCIHRIMVFKSGVAVFYGGILAILPELLLHLIATTHTQFRLLVYTSYIIIYCLPPY